MYRVTVFGQPPHEEVTASSAVGLGFREVRSIGVDIHDHVESMEPNSGVGVRGEIVKQLFCFSHGACGAVGLLDHNRAQGHEDRDVNCSSII